jgi:hypothetical protein
MSTLPSLEGYIRIMDGNTTEGNRARNRRVSAVGGVSGSRMTPAGDIELDIVFRIAVRGRTRDLAQLLNALNNAGAVMMCVVERPTEMEEQGQKDVTPTAGGCSR